MDLLTIIISAIIIILLLAVLIRLKKLTNIKKRMLNRMDYLQEKTEVLFKLYEENKNRVNKGKENIMGVIDRKYDELDEAIDSLLDIEVKNELGKTI